MKKCTVYSHSCPEHDGFIHGAEAEQLRSGIEAIMAEIEDGDEVDSIDRLRAVGDGIKHDLQRLLDRVDACDSLAFLEAQDADDEDEDEDEDDAEACESCQEPATKHDVEGVPLCLKCYDECVSECRAIAGAEREGGKS